MKIQFLFFISLALCIFSCSKDDQFANQVGNWTGVELQMLTTNGNVTSEGTINFTLVLNEDGTGTLNNTFSNNVDVHWVLDKEGNKIFIIRDFIVAGDERFSTTKFEMIKDTESDQEWTNTFSYTNLNNEIEDRFVKWTLTK